MQQSILPQLEIATGMSPINSIDRAQTDILLTINTFHPNPDEKKKGSK